MSERLTCEHIPAPGHEEDRSKALLSYRPVRSLRYGRIVCVEGLGAIPSSESKGKSACFREAIGDLKRHLDQLVSWQRSSFHKIPLLLKLPYCCLESQPLMAELATTCDYLGLDRGMVKLGAIQHALHDPKRIDALQSIRLLGFPLISAYSVDSVDDLSELLLGSDELEVDFSSAQDAPSNSALREQLADLLVQTRRSGIAVTAKGIRTPSDYEWLRATDGFVSAQGPFFWEAMPAEHLLRMELTFDKFFARGWRVVEGRFIPNNPQYFRPFPF